MVRPYRYHALPNPTVAAGIVRDGKFISTGIHKKAGAPHAEIMALRNAPGSVKGATIIVTLEPCTHTGRTPPCVDAIIDSGITTVVYACDDPNPRVRQDSAINRLTQSGIQVIPHICADQAADFNDVFIKNISKNLPFVVLKIGSSINGKIATQTGESKYITGPQSRAFSHQLRTESDAILIGVGTLCADDPELTVRHGIIGRAPVRVIVDPRGESPPSARIFKNRDTPIWIFTSLSASLPALPDHVEIMRIPPEATGRFLWTDIVKTLYEKGSRSVLIEGGSSISTSALEAGIVDRCEVMIAPVWIGGKNAPTAWDGIGISRLSDALQLDRVKYKRWGRDMGMTGYL